jgi:hypothetical protein
MPFQMLTNPIVMATAAFSKLSQYMNESQAAYERQSVEVEKLQKLMRNSMGARQGEIDSVLELASAQQKLGVIGDEVQISGAQELSTYLEKSESLKKLIPSMNDMLAQQYGLNATQEQAVTIAQMMGKVLDGQVGALSRYGYRFDEAQEKVLKFGTEEEKVAMLSNILQKYVGGVNEALAATPEGKLKQYANDAGDLQERVGKLVVNIKSALLPVQNFFLSLSESIVGFFESFYATVQNNQTLFTLLATAIGGVISAIILYTSWVKISALWTQLMTWFKAGEAAAWWAATVPMLITIGIITAIIAVIAAVTAAIVYCVKHVTGWGKTWDNVVTFMKLGFELFKESISLAWLRIKEDFLTGFDIIRAGWYKLKSLWDKEGANEGLAEIKRQRDERAKEIASAKNKVEELQTRISEMKIWELKTDGASFFGSAANKVAANAQLAASVNSPIEATSTGGSSAKSNESISTGGSRSTNITISIKDVIGQLHMNGTIKENVPEIERSMAEAFYRILGMAETSTSS